LYPEQFAPSDGGKYATKCKQVLRSRKLLRLFPPLLSPPLPFLPFTCPKLVTADR
jgi:hypothetical protein